jgi:hypothetical protein
MQTLTAGAKWKTRSEASVFRYKQVWYRLQYLVCKPVNTADVERQWVCPKELRGQLPARKTGTRRRVRHL